MPALFRPTAAERSRIRNAAAHEAELPARSVVLQIGQRRSTTGRGRAINVATISDDPEFADTDFDDEYHPWSAFANGVTLTTDAKGIFDIAIRRRGDADHDLHGHVTIYVEGNKVTRICGLGQEY